MEYDNGEILRGVLKIDGRAVRMRQCEAVSESAVRVNQQDGQNLLSENLLFTVCVCVYNQGGVRNLIKALKVQKCKSVKV